MSDCYYVLSFKFQMDSGPRLGTASGRVEWLKTVAAECLAVVLTLAPLGLGNIISGFSSVSANLILRYMGSTGLLSKAEYSY